MTARTRHRQFRTRDRTTTNPGLEEREVRTADPGLSADANERLTEDVRDVIGKERVRVPADRPHPSRGERRRQSTTLSVVRQHRLFIGQGAAAVVVIGAILGLTLNSWWILAIAAAVLLAALALIILLTFSMTSARERPAPATAAALEEEGIQDPEGHFSRVVEEFTEDEGARGRNERTVAAEDQPARAAAEQETATTPTGGPSHPVGPGRPGGGGDSGPRRQRARRRG